MLTQVRQAYCLAHYEEKAENLQRAVAALAVDASRLPKKTVGKFRSLFHSETDKETYRRQVAYLQELNQKSADVAQKLRDFSIDVSFPMAEVQGWIEDHFAEVRQLYQQKLQRKLVDPNSMPNLENLAEKLAFIKSFEQGTKNAHDIMTSLIADIREFSSRIARREADKRFVTIPLASFLT